MQVKIKIIESLLILEVLLIILANIIKIILGFWGSETPPFVNMNFIHGILGDHSKIKKNLVWHSHIFLLPCITVEGYFNISITFIFDLYFLWFVADELHDSVIIVYIF